MHICAPKLLTTPRSRRTLDDVPPVRSAAEPTVLDALELLLEVADELVVRTARDTHDAVGDRVHRVTSALTGGASRGTVHDVIAGGVYGGIGAGLRLGARAVGAAARTDAGPRLEDHPAGRHLRAAVNGLIGDRLDGEDRRLAVPMAARVDGRDVPPTADALRSAYPDAGGRVVVLLHGLGESDETWRLGRRTRGTTYAEELAEDGWTPVVLRMNTGLPLRVNGVALAGLLEDLVEGWPVPVERLALVGHSMGGLVIRTAGAVGGTPRWQSLVSDVVTLGSPHRGAPLAAIVGRGGSLLGGLRESAAFGRVLDQRSAGIRDLVEGVGGDVPLLPGARHRLVSATVTTSPRHPVGVVLGDLLVREESAYGRRSRGGADDVFGEASATTLHVGGTGHFGLLNHPVVAERLREWLA